MASQDNAEAGLSAAFADWTDALNSGDMDRFYAYFHEESETLDEDFPWRYSKSEIIDHFAFHGRDLWEFFEWVPRDVVVKAWGQSGHVSGFATFRGKPRDAGFRQRYMGFTISWHYTDEGWRLTCWHQSPLLGRIVGASPS